MPRPLAALHGWLLLRLERVPGPLGPQGQLPSAGAQLLGAYKAVKGCPPAALRLVSSMFVHANNHQPSASQAGAIGCPRGLAKALKTLPVLFLLRARNNSPAPPLR